nr:unnamed protein product [Callosobruchus chinensis]
MLRIIGFGVKEDENQLVCLINTVLDNALVDILPDFTRSYPFNNFNRLSALSVPHPKSAGLTAKIFSKPIELLQLVYAKTCRKSLV